MLTKILPAALLMAFVTGAAHAASWQFKYQGFLDRDSGTFDPSLVLQGSFEGSDADGDGVIELAELTHLAANGFNFTGCNIEIHEHCRIEFFNYSLNGNLSFLADNTWHDEFWMSRSFTAYTGRDVWYSRTENNGSSSSRQWIWTDETTFTITPPPVPEPATYAMLGVGALLLGARQWRVRRSQH